MASVGTAEGTAAPRGARRGRLSILLNDPGARIALLAVLALVLVALLAPVLAPFDPTAQHVADALQPPGSAYWFGTDEFGRDVFSRMVHGTRPALLVGLCSVALAVCVGTPIGLAAGFLGGWLDTAVSGVVDVLLSFPSLLLAMMVVTLAGSGLDMVVLAIALSQVPIFVRLARSSAMVLRELDYVAASRSFGAGRLYVLRRHILPNSIGPIVVMATLGIAGAIREEAGLSFLGLGVQPPAPSWGNLIYTGVANILDAPWLALLPGMLLTMSVLAFNILGDSVRDILDPRDIAAAGDAGQGRRG
jgi:peptide/nickel transport system permease protein